MPEGEKTIPNPPRWHPNLRIMDKYFAAPDSNVLNNNNYSNCGQIALYAAFGFNDLCIGNCINISIYISNKKFKDDIELRNKKYGEIIHSIRKELEIAREQQKKGMLIMNPDPAECIRRVETIDRRLWERTPQFKDFLSARIGIGTTPWQLRLMFKVSC